MAIPFPSFFHFCCKRKRRIERERKNKNYDYKRFVWRDTDELWLIFQIEGRQSRPRCIIVYTVVLKISIYFKKRNKWEERNYSGGATSLILSSGISGSENTSLVKHRLYRLYILSHPLSDKKDFKFLNFGKKNCI